MSARTCIHHTDAERASFGCPVCEVQRLRADLDVADLQNNELRAEVERLRSIEAAARALIEYQSTGDPYYPDWDRYFDALETALQAVRGAQRGAK